MHPDEKRPSVVALLEAAVAHYKALGVTIKRLITTTAPPIDRSCSRAPAKPLASSRRSPATIYHRPMARQNASSRLAYANGPMGASGRTAKSAPPGCLRSWPTTTPAGPTRPWATKPQLLGSPGTAIANQHLAADLQPSLAPRRSA